MDVLSRFTDVLIASWVLADEGSAEQTALPLLPDILDRALRNAVRNGAFGALAEGLAFVDSRVGLRCVELPEILDLAQECLFLPMFHPSDRRTEVNVSSRAARQLLWRHSVSEADANMWGTMLHDEVRAATKIMSAYPQVR